MTHQQSKLREESIAIAQLQSALHEAGIAPPPPRHLQERDCGGYFEDFLTSGQIVCLELDTILRPVDKTLNDFSRILEFGCGVGRVIRALFYRRGGKGLYGTDIDSEAIAWCQDNYGNLATFDVNEAEPPTRYPDDYFDFIYAISVFTHLPEDMQFRWLGELARITKPQGYLVLSVHGANHFGRGPGRSLGGIELRCVEDKGFFYNEETSLTEGLPDFYKSTWHLPHYIKARWSEYFDILDVIEDAIGGNHQAAVLCQAR